MNPRLRLDPKVRKQQILDAAIALACREGYNALKRDAVAVEAQCSAGKVNQAFSNIKQLRESTIRTMVQHAVKGDASEVMLKVIGQSLGDGNREAHKAPLEVKQAALITLI